MTETALQTRADSAAADARKQVPGWLTGRQLEVLGRVAAELPPDAMILDIGAACGQASLALMQAAPPGARLLAVSAWDPPGKVEDRTPLRTRDGGRASCDQRAFEAALAGHPVEAINSSRPIMSVQQHKPEQLYDLIFLYEGYGEVPFELQVDFWFGKLKPMGLLCGGDFVHGFRDVVRTLLRYGTRKRVALGIEQNIWQMYNAV